MNQELTMSFEEFHFRKVESFAAAINASVAELAEDIRRGTSWAREGMIQHEKEMRRFRAYHTPYMKYFTTKMFREFWKEIPCEENQIIGLA